MEEVPSPERECRNRHLHKRAACCTAGRTIRLGFGAEEEPGCNQCQREPGELAGRQRLAQHHHHQHDGDDKIQPEDRCVDADRAGGQAADEVVEAEENEDAGKRAPQRRRFEHKRVGRERIEDDERAEEPPLRHQEMVGRDAGSGGLLVDEVGEAVARHRHNGVDEGSLMPAVRLRGDAQPLVIGAISRMWRTLCEPRQSLPIRTSIQSRSKVDR